MKLTKENLLEMYRKMVRVRILEEGITKFDDEGIVPGTGHVSIGEEAVAVGAISAMGEKDYLVSTHRGHGHVITRGASLPIILAEVLGKATGCTGGKGGSMHISDFDRYILGTNGIVGGGLNIAGGVGLAIKLQKTDQVCLCFFGDGASNRGTFHEALNLASMWKVPTVYVCVNNQYAMTLPFCRGCSVQDISARAASYDIPGYKVDGLDVVAVYEAVGSAMERARKGGGPSLVEAVTYRMRGHSMRMDKVPGGTDYRPDGEIEDWRENKDPNKIFKKKLIELGYLTDELADKIQAECQKEFDEATDFALNSPEPKPESIFEGIYA